LLYAAKASKVATTPILTETIDPTPEALHSQVSATVSDVWTSNKPDNNVEL
jgi:hypothetical protein